MNIIKQNVIVRNYNGVRSALRCTLSIENEIVVGVTSDNDRLRDVIRNDVLMRPYLDAKQVLGRRAEDITLCNPYIEVPVGWDLLDNNLSPDGSEAE